MTDWKLEADTVLEDPGATVKLSGVMSEAPLSPDCTMDCRAPSGVVYLQTTQTRWCSVALT